ncbi:MAG: ion channel, partial [Smithella sp.]
LLPLLSRWFRNLTKILASYVLCLVWGYGERPLRVIFTSAFTIFLYALSYQWLDALSISGLKTAFYFSTVTFTTLGYGDVIPKPEFRMFAASEALAGIILTGLFLFTLARRASARG